MHVCRDVAPVAKEYVLAAHCGICVRMYLYMYLVRAYMSIYVFMLRCIRLLCTVHVCTYVNFVCMYVCIF